MEILTLYKGEHKAIVEAGSQGEAEFRAAGYSDKKPKGAPVSAPEAEPAPTPAKKRGRPRKGA